MLYSKLYFYSVSIAILNSYSKLYLAVHKRRPHGGRREGLAKWIYADKGGGVNSRGRPDLKHI